jgi:ribonuclease PH
MKKIGEVLSNTLNVLGVAVSVQDITNYLNLTLLIVSVINMSLILYFNIKSAIERAKEDGKVTKEEVEEITNIATEGVQEIKNKIDNFKEEK